MISDTRNTKIDIFVLTAAILDSTALIVNPDRWYLRRNYFSFLMIEKILLHPFPNIDVGEK